MEKNKMEIKKTNYLIWTIGFPMILSMILQAIYNVIDTAFIINSSAGTYGNEALTFSFPIQIIMIAFGVGSGVGINATLAKKLGEKKQNEVNKIVGNGIFIIFIIYIIFLVFGCFFANKYMKFMSDNENVIEYGTDYLRICCCLSLGSIGFTIYGRFVQATGKTIFSMIAQITGAVSNILLDSLFIFGFGMGVKGAAYATVIAQFLSLFIVMFFHYTKNKEINNNFKYIIPSKTIIKGIYKIGFPAVIMQGLLAVMMFLSLLVIKTIPDESTISLMTNSFGIYYKIMQIALFACFGLSNALITIVAFNYGLKNYKKVIETIKYGLLNSIIISLVMIIIFQIFAKVIVNVFAFSLPVITDEGVLKSDIIYSCKLSLHIASLGYLFMSINVAIQGILQGLRNVLEPVLIAIFRLIIFVLPIMYIFCKLDNVDILFWFVFPISETFTLLFSFLFLRNSLKKITKNAITQNF